jgi:hypothetical protein
MDWNKVEDFLFTSYTGSLYNIGREIREKRAVDPVEQDRICRKWGRTLESLTGAEAEYVEDVINGRN